MIFVYNKGTYQPVYQLSLIRVIDVCCLYLMIAEQVDLGHTWLQGFAQIGSLSHSVSNYMLLYF